MTIIAETQRIRIAKWLDEYVGRCLVFLLHRLQPNSRHRSTQHAAKRILFIKFWGIGSIILAEPALRNLRQQFQHARLDFLTLTQNRELFALIAHVDQVYALDFRHLGRFLLSALRLVAQLRNQKYDLVFDAEFFANSSALLAHLLKPGVLIGFSRNASYKNCLLDVAVPFDDHRHATENFCRLVNLRNEIESENIEMSNTPCIDLPCATSMLRRFGHRSMVVMNINASPLALERRWPRERFEQLGKWLLHRYEIELALIGAQSEKEYTQAATRAMDLPARVHDLAGTLNLSELAELISASALLISNDSGPLHLAAALQKPVVGFYGPETPERFGPLCNERLIFYLGLPCSPCMSVDNAKTVDCTNHRRCMLDLSVGMVIRGMQAFVDENDLLPKRFVRRQIAVEV